MPSCTRAPPESLMKTNGEPVFSDMLHDLGDLDGMHFARRPAGYREILACQVHQAPGDRCRAGHHAVGRKALSGHAEQRGAMLGEQPGLLEAVRIHQRLYPFTRRQFAALVLLLQPVLAAAQHGFAGAFAEIGDLLLHCMNGHMKSLSNPLLSRRYGYFVRLALQFDVVGNGGAHRALAVFHRRRFGRRRGCRGLRSRDLCPNSSDPDDAR